MIVGNYAGWVGNWGIFGHKGGETTSFSGTSLYPGPDCVSEAVVLASGGVDVPFSVMKRLFMESQTVEAALTAIVDRKLTFGACGQLVADTTGAAFNLEVANGELEVVSLTGRKAHGRANTVQTPRWQAADQCCKFELSVCSNAREARIQALLRENEQGDRYTPEVLQRFCSDREGSEVKRSICRTREKQGDPWTNAAFVADLANGAIDICIGSPLDQPWIRYTLDNI
jgi:hypothetical protein